MCKTIGALLVLLLFLHKSQANTLDEFDEHFSLETPCADKKGINSSYKDKYQIAECLRANGRYKDAINYYYDVLKYKKKQRPEIKDYLLYFQISDCLESTGQIQEALNLANRTLDSYKAEHGNNDRIYIRILCLIARLHRINANYIRSESLLYNALNYVIEKHSENSPLAVRIYSDLATVYIQTNKVEEAEELTAKALKIAINNNKLDYIDISNVYYSIGRIKESKEDYIGAIDNGKKSIKVLMKLELNSKIVEMLAARYSFLGNIYYYLSDYKEAIRHSELLLNKIYQFQGNLDNTVVPVAMNKIGACLTNLQEYDKAAEKLELALKWFKFNIQNTNPFEIEGNKRNLLITLYFKAKNNLQRYLKYGCEEDLEQAHAEYDVCIRLIDHIISSYDGSDSRQYLVDRFYYIFESIIEVNYQFYRLRGERQYVDRAMRYMEKSRSILLKEMMQHNKAVILAGVPDTMLAQEHGLREQIAGLENRKYESERKLPAGQQSDLVFHRLNDSLFILREQYWALLKQIEQRYPEYYTMKHADRSTETPAIVNRLLQPQEALVQYFVGDDHIYTLVYRSDGACSMIKAPVGDLDQNIKDLRESIYGYVLTPSDSLVKAYADGAHRLYETLLQPISGYLPYRVTIIPDGLLEYLPFEALLTEKADPNSSFRAWPYCLRKYSFCYAHSVLSLETMRERQNRPKYRQVLAVAPSFSPALAVRNTEERRRSFGALEDNLAEVAGIRDLFPAKTLVGPEATVEAFKAQAGDYSVLHLATHAKADNENGEYAYVAFTETNDTTNSNLLYLKNLYTLPLHADMVALSACETGVGKLRRGEGVVSLARGFSYAGANSLVTTLWRISDRESATLMQRYYVGLKNDLTKDEALRQAKLNYLDEASGNRAHPFFWAAFVTIGDMEPLDLPDGGWMWWLLAGLLPVGYILWRKFSGGRGKLAKSRVTSTPDTPPSSPNMPSPS